MKNFSKAVLTVIVGILLALFSSTQAMAATNDAVDGGSPSLSLVPSGLVTVNASAITLIKQVYDMAGNCLASDVNAAGADACAATSVTVASGTPMQFLLYIRNTTAFQLNDVRFIDDIDDTAGALGGFTYSPAGPGDISITPLGGTLDTALASDIYTDATTAGGGTLQTDVLGAPDDYVSVTNQGGQANLDYVTVGAVAAPIAQANQVLNIPANSTFAVLIPVTKN